MFKEFFKNLLSEENKKILVKRLKSLAWRVGNVVALLLVNFIADSIGLFNLPPIVITGVGLFTAEITKHLNSNR